MKNYAEIRHINPCQLIVHTELLRIYGNGENGADLNLDIEENGIIVPLVVSTRTSENIVVSGNRRLQAAIAAGFDSVPVVFYKFPSEEAEKHFLLSANQERPKTKYQQLLEGGEWELIEKNAAALRRKKGLNQRWKSKDGDGFDSHDYYPPTLLSDYRSASCDALQSSNKKQRATDKVGAKIGMSGRTYERAKPIVEKCKQLRDEGKKLEATALEEYLESSGINAAARLLKLADCNGVLSLVATGKAKNISSALTSIARINKMSAIAPGAIFFFPDKMLRKPAYYHEGRVVSIANSTATICFRDGIDWELHEHQYKCDELLCLNCREDELSQQSLRERMNYLLAHSNVTPTDRYILNRLLRAVTSISDEIEYLQIIEWRVAGVRDFVGVAA